MTVIVAVVAKNPVFLCRVLQLSHDTVEKSSLGFHMF